MLISTKRIIGDLNEVKEGETGLECTVCKRKFAIPTEEAKKFNPGETLICEDCGEKADKAAAASSVADMKADTAADTADTIKKALGN